MKLRTLSAQTLFMALALSACTPDRPGERHLDGPWRFKVNEFANKIELCRDTGSTCSTADLPPLAARAAGWNRDFILVSGNPVDSTGAVDRDTTLFFYVIRPMNESPDAMPIVKGPFEMAAYEAHKVRLGLPDFSETILQDQ